MKGCVLIRSLYKVLVIFSAVIIVSCTSRPDLKWHEAEGYRWAKVSPGFFGSDGFRQLDPSHTNIQFRNDISEKKITENRHFLNGSGIAVADIDGNGLVDIYFARLDGPNKLYKNLGNYWFRDITVEAGLSHEGYHSTGVVFADVNGNGYPDLLVTSLLEKNALYINDGKGNFTFKEDSGLEQSNGAKTMALVDINGNGFPDLYITNYKPRSVTGLFPQEELVMENTVEVVNGELRVIPPYDEHYSIFNHAGRSIRVENGARDELYMNQGDGTFRKAADADHFFDPYGNPMELPRDWGLTATFRDITGNGLPDLYVANDFWTPDRLWINQGDGTFRSMDRNMIRSLSFSSMGVDFSDINRDGHLDFIVTEMLSREHTRRLRQTSQNLSDEENRALNNRNSLYLNRGDNTFAQISQFSGLHASEWSWSTYFMDVNLNGYEDLIVATGYSYDYLDMDTQFQLHEQQTMGVLSPGSDILSYPPLALNNKLFRNNGDLTFTDVSSEWGFDVEDVSLGMALADLNNDGTLDLIINRLNDYALVYQNRTNAPRIAVRLKGKSPNTGGIGAKIELTGGPVYQQKEMVSGGNYLSGSQGQVVFAADRNNKDHVITVTWPNGKRSKITNVQSNRIYEIDEAFVEEAGESHNKMELGAETLFEDVSDRIHHLHQENDFDDSVFQPLLPQKMSQLGPGIAWIDVNRNGRDDLLIGTGKGGELALFENTGEGFFQPAELDPVTSVAPGDQSAIISWTEDDYRMIVTGSINYEQGAADVPSAYLYSISPSGNIEKVDIPGTLSATGPLAAADVTGNGYIDLFIGGRFKPGRYPVHADSRLFLNDGSGYRLDQNNAAVFTDMGLVTSAVFTDINQNGRPDLLLSTEWGELKLLENRNGIFHEITEEAGLNNFKGWWRGVATGDFTNNGLPDIVAANIGLNSAYQLENNYPLRMYYNDLNWDGQLNIVEAYFDDEIGTYVPRRRLHDFGSVPTILQNVRSHSQYAHSTLVEIFGVDFGEIPFKEINTLEHMVFLNNGDGTFAANPLPVKAQFSAGFHVGAADFDNDGFEDLFISMNDFSFPDYISRMDAGRGLILKGDGQGNFTPVPGQKSGIKIYGEQRGAAFSDFNLDGRVDLAVTQNSGATKLYLNKTENPGLSVRLIGPASNTDAVGSSLRIVYKDGSIGSRREIQAGSGYWSQNSRTQIMGLNGHPEYIEISWFDGTSKTVSIEENKTSYIISH